MLGRYDRVYNMIVHVLHNTHYVKHLILSCGWVRTGSGRNAPNNDTLHEAIMCTRLGLATELA